MVYGYGWDPVAGMPFPIVDEITWTVLQWRKSMELIEKQLADELREGRLVIIHQRLDFDWLNNQPRTDMAYYVYRWTPVFARVFDH